MSNSSDFVQRYRTFLDSRARDDARRSVVQSEKRAQFLDACTRLHKELLTFGQELGHIEVEAGPETVVYRRGDRTLVFHLGDAEIAYVRFGHPESRQIELGYTMREGWFLNVPKAEPVRFFDSGLHALLVTALELPSMPGGPDADGRPFAVLLDDGDISVVEQDG